MPVTRTNVIEDIAALSWSVAESIAIEAARSAVFRRMGKSLMAVQCMA